MTRISPRHPRYQSLRARAQLGEAARTGLVVPEGLIAQGRSEAFDYLLGERTRAGARRATRAAATWLANARHPVISVNGNVAAVGAEGIATLVRRLPALQVEVNLFHRTPARARAVRDELTKAGIPSVLGVRPTARLRGLPSDRALIDARGIGLADVCLIPLEDGDRTLALRRAGKRVIAVDLNPLSRTAQTADIPVIDELRRVLENLAEDMPRAVRHRDPGYFPPFDRRAALMEALEEMARGFRRVRRISSPVRASPPPSRGTAGRSRRTPPPRRRRPRGRR